MPIDAGIAGWAGIFQARRAAVWPGWDGLPFAPEGSNVTFLSIALVKLGLQFISEEHSHFRLLASGKDLRRFANSAIQGQSNTLFHAYFGMPVHQDLESQIQPARITQ